MRDLRNRRVFARLVYAVAVHELDRLMHGIFKLIIGRPIAQGRQFLNDLESRRSLAELILSAAMTLATLIRSVALLLFSVAVLALTFARL